MMKSIEVTNFTGKIGCVGLYLPSDPGGENDQARAGVYPLPLGQFFFRGLSLGAGRANVKKYNPYPRDLTVAGRPIPSPTNSRSKARRTPARTSTSAPTAMRRFSSSRRGPHSKRLLNSGTGVSEAFGARPSRDD